MTEKKFASASPLRPRKRAILLGASSGIGAALARRLAHEGYLLALAARREAMLESLCATLNAEAGECCARAYRHDVGDTASAAGLFQQMTQDLGGLDLFIYSSGALLPLGLKEFDAEKDLAMTRVNYLGALSWLNPAAAYFQAVGRGQIVGIGSVAGDRGRVGAPAYNASKAALHTYLEALRNRLSRRGVNVLTIKPGFVATDMIRNSARTPMVISPEQAAEGIWQAMRARRQTAYVPAQWGLLMLVIRHIPSFIFRKLTF